MLSPAAWAGLRRGFAEAGSGRVAASMKFRGPGTGGAVRDSAAPPEFLCLWLGGLRLDDLVEDELAADDAISSVIRQRGVATTVDRVLAEHRVAVLDLEERVDDGLLVVALVPGVLDGQQGDLHRLVAVDRVGLRVLAELLLERLEEVLRGRRVELRDEGRV